MTSRLAACFLALWGCSGDAEHRLQYEAYVGPAVYPERNAPLPAPLGELAFVSDHGSDTISVLDLPRAAVLARAHVGREPVSIDGPQGVVVAPSGEVFTLLSYPPPSPLPGPHAKHTTAIRYGFLQKLARDDVFIIGELQLEANPASMVLNRDGSRLIVTHFDLARARNATLPPEEQKSTMKVIETETLTARSSTRVCRALAGVALASDDRTAFAACYADDAIAVVDTLTGVTPQILPAGCKGPSSVESDSTGKQIAVGCLDSRSTRIVDASTRTLRDDNFVTEGIPFAAAWSLDGERLWIPTQSPDALIVFDVAAGKVLLQRVFDAGTCLRPHHAKLASATLYLVCEGDHVSAGRVLALDPATLSTRASAEVGVFPNRLALRSTP